MTGNLTVSTSEYETLEKREKTYHHGDLKAALINASMSIIDTTGRWDFSLREVAKAAEVSHNAPYGHFVDKAALLAAVGVEGYGHLRSEMLLSAAQFTGSTERLQAIGSAYVRFGLRHRALYKLMFGQDINESGLLTAAAEQSRMVLRDVIMEGGADGSFDIEGPNGPDMHAAVLAAWSLIHGFTLLAIDGWADSEMSGDHESLADRISFRFLQGLRAKEPS